MQLHHLLPRGLTCVPWKSSSLGVGWQRPPKVSRSARVLICRFLLMGDLLSLLLSGVRLSRSFGLLLTAPPNLPLKGETSFLYLPFSLFLGVFEQGGGLRPGVRLPRECSRLRWLLLEPSICSPGPLCCGARMSETWASRSWKSSLSSSSISSIPISMPATSSPNSSFMRCSFSSSGFSRISKFWQLYISARLSPKMISTSMRPSAKTSVLAGLYLGFGLFWEKAIICCGEKQTPSTLPSSQTCWQVHAASRSPTTPQRSLWAMRFWPIPMGSPSRAISLMPLTIWRSSSREEGLMSSSSTKSGTRRQLGRTRQWMDMGCGVSLLWLSPMLNSMPLQRTHSRSPQMGQRLRPRHSHCSKCYQTFLIWITREPFSPI